jgi:predicted N-acetyltransferase YhbS
MKCEEPAQAGSLPVNSWTVEDASQSRREGIAMVMIRHEAPNDVEAREALLDRALGEGRFAKSSERLRENRLPADQLSFVACDKNRVIGTVRLWDVLLGPGRPALLLGPLAVACDQRRRGIGAALVRRALGEAKRLGHTAVVLVGDEPYYGRFGFSSAETARLWMPGPYERARLLACALVPGSLDGARGLISASGRPAPKPDLSALLAGLVRSSAAPRAA